MAKGCLVLTGLFAIALVAERAAIVERGLPLPWAAATALAATLTLALASAEGVARALRRRREPETAAADWRDGESVRTGGRVEAATDPLRAPLSGRQAVVAESSIYRVRSRAVIGGNLQARPTPPHARGVEMVPFLVRGPAGAVAIQGCPGLGRFPEVDCADEPSLERAARLLAQEPWRVSTVAEGWNAAQGLLGGAEASLPLRLINPEAVRVLLAPEGEPSAGRWSGGPTPDLEGEPAVAAILARLARRSGQQPWHLKERCLAPGDEVTVEGIYRANPPRIEVGRGPAAGAPERGIRPGLPALTGRQEARTASVFALALAAAAAAAHWVVFASDGALYRAFVAWWRQAS